MDSAKWGDVASFSSHFTSPSLKQKPSFHVWTQKNGCSNSNRLIHLPLSCKTGSVKTLSSQIQTGSIFRGVVSGRFFFSAILSTSNPHQRSWEYHHFLFVWRAQRTAVMMLCNCNMQIDETCKIPANRKFRLMKCQFNCTTLMNNTETNVSCWGHTVWHRNVQPSIKLN